MHLYIWSSEFATEVADIKLADGCIPSIGAHHLSGEDEDVLPEVEPAVWFKVLVVDAVSVDCGKRAILWTCSNVPEKQQSLQPPAPHYSADRRRCMSESMYIAGECSGYQSDLDELFDSAQDMLLNYSKGLLSGSQLQSAAAQLLHCYILPAIKLGSGDMRQLQHALEMQKLDVEAADQAILKKNNQVEEIRASMARQRDKFLAQLSDQSGIKPVYQSKFAEVLRKNIVDDVKRAWADLDILQEQVQKAKKLNETVSLTAVREARDAEFQKYHELLLARENLDEIIKLSDSKKTNSLGRKAQKKKDVTPQNSPVMDALHVVYLGFHETLAQHVKELQALAQRKVMILSVKEAVRTTIKEIQSGMDSYGIEFDKTGCSRATDVLQHQNIPRKWLSLTEKVYDLLTFRESRVSVQHHSFRDKVNEFCKHICNEKDLEDLYAFGKRSGKRGDKLQDDSAKHVEKEDVGSCDRPLSVRSADTDSSSNQSRGDSGLSADSNPGTDSSCEAASHDILNVSSSPDSISTGCLSVSLRRKSKSSSGKNRKVTTELFDQIDSLIQFDVSMQGSDDEDDKIVVIHNSANESSKKLISQLKDDIHEHCHQMATALQESLGYINNQVYYRKLWLCYESHFYAEVMGPLVKLYEYVYGENIQSNSALLTTNDLDISHSIVFYTLEISRKQATSIKQQSADKIEVASAAATEVSVNNSTSAGVNLLETPVHITKRSASYSGYPREIHNPSSHRANKAHSMLGSTKSFRSEHCTAPKLTNITVHRPMSVTILCERHSWNTPGEVGHAKDVDDGIEALHLDSVPESDLPRPEDTESSNMISSDSLILQDKYCAIFLPFLKLAISESAPLLKLQQLTRCLREINTVVSSLQKQLQSRSIGACSDDLMDFLIVLICNCNISDRRQLYSHLCLLRDLMPPFLDNGPYSFTLVQFTIAFQFLQDRWLMRQKTHHKESTA